MYELADPITGLKETIVQSGYIRTLQGFISYFINQALTYFIQIFSNIDYGFRIPGTVDYNEGSGVTLIVEAVAGITVLTVRIRSNPECFHVISIFIFQKFS